jgi:hypothetical protein
MIPAPLTYLLRSEARGLVYTTLRAFRRPYAWALLIGFGVIAYEMYQDGSSGDLSLQRDFEQFGGLALTSIVFLLAGAGLNGYGIFINPSTVQGLVALPLKQREVAAYLAMRQVAFLTAVAAVTCVLLGIGAFAWNFSRILPVMLLSTAIPFTVATISQRLTSRTVVALRRLHLGVFWTAAAYMIVGLIKQVATPGRGAMKPYWSWGREVASLPPFDFINHTYLSDGIGWTLAYSLAPGLFALVILLWSSTRFDFQSPGYLRAQKVAQGSSASFHDEGMIFHRRLWIRWQPAPFPFWGGIGPLLWRRACEALRQPQFWGGTLLFAIGYHITAMGMIIRTLAISHHALEVSWIRMLEPYMAPLFSIILSMRELRADRRRLEFLKSLPIETPRAVFAHLSFSASWVIVYLWIAAAIDASIVHRYYPDESVSPLLLHAALWAPPLGLLTSGVSNSLFLLLPSNGANDRVAITTIQVVTAITIASLVGMGLIALHWEAFFWAKTAGLNTDWGLDFLGFAVLSLAARAMFRVTCWAYGRVSLPSHSG